MKSRRPDTELRRIQRAFTGHLRNPDEVPVPEGLDARRMGVYESLIFGNLSSLLSDFFPVIRSILTEDQWRALVREFFICHQAETPYFPRVAEEMVKFLSGRQLQRGEPDFLLELAHYEWVELVLYTSEVEPPESNIDPARLSSEPVTLSPLAMPLIYEYPVHRISTDYQPAEPGEVPTCLLVFRDRADSVRFFELQPLAYRLLEALEENPGLVIDDWLHAAVAEAGVDDGDQFVNAGMALVQQFNEEGLFLAHD